MTRPQITLRIPEGASEDEVRRIEAAHVLSSLAEGLCPHCAAQLEPARGDSASRPTGRPWLRCTECWCYWQADPAKIEWTWEASWSWHGRDPFPGGRWGI